MPDADAIPPVSLFYGDEDLRVREAEDAAVARALGDDRSGFNFASFDAADADVASRLVDQARTMPMMARRRVLQLKGVDKAPAALMDALLEYLEKPNPSTVLIISGRKLPETSGGVNRGARLRNRVAKVGEVARFEAGKEDPLAFARGRADALGCRLDREAAELLVELSGRDLSRLSMELEKAANWLGGEGTITAAVVEQTCSVVGESEVWALTGALVRRDADAALASTHRLLQDGNAPHYLLAMVTWQFRQLLTLQDCQRRGIDPKTVGLRMRWRALQEAEASLRARPLSEASLLASLARANRQLNRARAGDQRVFEGIVLELATR